MHQRTYHSQHVPTHDGKCLPCRAVISVGKLHHTKRHSEQGRKDVDAIRLGKKCQFEGKISSSVVGAYGKGVDKIKKDFKGKLYDCFPDIRYHILVENEGDEF